MKKFTIEVSHASSPQLATIALELKIMSNGQKLQAPSLRVPGSAKSYKRQASSLTACPRDDRMNLSVTSHDKQTFSTTVVAPEDNLQKGAHEIMKGIL